LLRRPPKPFGKPLLATAEVFALLGACKLVVTMLFCDVAFRYGGQSDAVFKNKKRPQWLPLRFEDNNSLRALFSSG
jgi:hypothetical protein